MMKTIKPIYNHGRWIVLCPVHETRGAMPAEQEYICPVCHPKINAILLVNKKGIWQTIPDTSARRTGRLEAERKNEIYAVVFPKDRAGIETELAKLPINKRHWKSGSLKELKEDVKMTKHIISNYEKRNKKLDGNDVIMLVTRS